MVKLITYILFCLASTALSQNYETFKDVRLNNNLTLEFDYINNLKMKNLECYKKVELLNNDNNLELYDVCLRNDSLTVLIEDKMVYQGRTKGAKDNLGSHLLFKSNNSDTICYPINVTILYHDNKKKINFKIPKGSKRITLRGYFNNNLRQKMDTEQQDIQDFVKVSFSHFNYLQYRNIISCEKIQNNN